MEKYFDTFIKQTDQFEDSQCNEGKKISNSADFQRFEVLVGQSNGGNLLSMHQVFNNGQEHQFCENICILPCKQNKISNNLQVTERILAQASQKRAKLKEQEEQIIELQLQIRDANNIKNKSALNIILVFDPPHHSILQINNKIKVNSEKNYMVAVICSEESSKQQLLSIVQNLDRVRLCCDVYSIEDINKLQKLINQNLKQQQDVPQLNQVEQKKIIEIFRSFEISILSILQIEQFDAVRCVEQVLLPMQTQRQRLEEENEKKLLNIVDFNYNLDEKVNQSLNQKRGFGLLMSRLAKRTHNTYEQQVKNKAIDEIDSGDVQEDPYQKVIEQMVVSSTAQELTQNSQKKSEKISKEDEEQRPKRKVGHGQLILQKQLRGTETTLINLIDNFYINPKNEILRSKKVFIIAQSNKRADQISQIEESYKSNKNFRFKKYQANQKQKKQDKTSFEQEFKNYDIFLMLPKKLLSLLKRGELPIEYIDLLVIDEANLFPQHTVNQMLIQFYYNHITTKTKILLNDGREIAPIKRPLPYVLGFVSLDSILCESSTSKIYDKLRMLCSILNTNLCVFNTEETSKLLKEYLQLLKKIDFDKDDPVECLAKYGKVKQFISNFVRFICRSDQLGDKKALQIRPSDKIFDLKKLQECFYFTTQREGPFSAESLFLTGVGAKCCHQEAREFLESLGSKVKEILDDMGISESQEDKKEQQQEQAAKEGTSQQTSVFDVKEDKSKALIKKQGKNNNAAGNVQAVFKPEIVTIQYVESKVRYYSSKLKIDWILRPLFAYCEEYKNAKEIEFYSEKCLIPIINQSTLEEKVILLKKKLEVESWVMLEACKKLYLFGFFDSFMRPDKNKIIQAIRSFYGISTPEILIDDKKDNNESQSQISDQSTQISTQISTNIDQISGNQQPNKEIVEKSKDNSTIDKTLEYQEEVKQSPSAISQQEESKATDEDYASDDSVDTVLSSQINTKTDYQLTQTCSDISQINEIRLSKINELKKNTDFLLKYAAVLDEYKGLKLQRLQLSNKFQEKVEEEDDEYKQQEFDQLISQKLELHEQIKMTNHKRNVQKYSDCHNTLTIQKLLPKNHNEYANKQWELNRAKLRIVIQNILNPILKATQKYTNLLIEQSKEQQKEDSMIQWKETQDFKESKPEQFKVAIYIENQNKDIQFFEDRDFVKHFINIEYPLVFQGFSQVQISRTLNYITIIYEDQDKMLDLLIQVNENRVLDKRGLKFVARPYYGVKQKNAFVFNFEEHCKHVLLPESERNSINSLEKHHLIQELYQLIDDAADKLILPQVLNQHCIDLTDRFDTLQKSGNIKEELKKVHQSRNKYNLLLMLSVALASKPSKYQRLEEVKDEFARLAFMGDSAITLAVVYHCMQYLPTNYSEKDMDAFKMKNIKSDNIKIKAIKSGLSMLLMREEGTTEGDFRCIEEVYQSFVGFLTLYIGFDACLMFLYDTGLLKLEDRWFSYANIDQKVALLKDFSCKRMQLININSVHKKFITEKINQHAKQLMAPRSKQWDMDQCLKLTQRGTSNITSRIQAEMLEEMDRKMENELIIYNREKAKELGLFVNQEENRYDEACLDQQKCPKSKKASSSDGNFQQLIPANKAYQDYEQDSDQGGSSIIEDSIEKLKSQSSRKQEKTAGEELDAIDNMSFHSSQKSSLYTKHTNFTESSDIQDPYIDGYPNYEFNYPYLLLQAFTHKTFAEKLFKKIMSGRDIKNIYEDFQNTVGPKGEIGLSQSKAEAETMKLELDTIAEELYHFNYQRLEYLGDAILNYTLAKQFYFDTLECSQNWHKDYYSAMKLHDLKTYFTSNSWLAFLTYEHFFMTINKADRKNFYQLFYDEKAKDSKVDIAKIKIPFSIPFVPLLYDDSNSHYDNQLKSYQDMLFRICASAQRKRNKQQLTLKAYIYSDEADTDEIDFAQLQERFIKLLSDVMEAIIGAIFQDSGNLSKTENAVLRLLSSRYMKEFPLKEHERTKVLNVWNSKKYAQPIKLTHSIEEKNDDTYLRAYFSNLEVRRVKFSKDHKKKVSKFYFVVMKYLEVAYYEFELKEANEEKKQGLTPQSWLEFNRGYRREYDKIKKTEPKVCKVGCQVCKSTCPIFNKLSKISLQLAEQYEKEQRPYQYREMLQEIFSRFEQEQKAYLEKHNNIFSFSKFLILELENERVKNSRIREIFNRADIKSLTSDKPDISPQMFIKNLSERQTFRLFNGFKFFGNQLQGQIFHGEQPYFQQISRPQNSGNAAQFNDQQSEFGNSNASTMEGSSDSKYGYRQ